MQTEVLLGPLRQTALLAKQVATLDLMSAGRFRLGIGVGVREDDHRAAGTPFRTRGRDLDQQLAELRRIWSLEPDADGVATVGPRPARRVPILIGGFRQPALARVAAYGDGFVCAAPPTWAGGLFTQVRDGWHAAGRTGEPWMVAQLNVAVGPSEVAAEAGAAMGAYYAFTGREGMRPEPDPRRVQEMIAQFVDLGVDEIVLYCYGSDPDQIERLAELLDVSAPS